MLKKQLHPYHESHFRSISKALTWRVVATTTTFLITYYVILSIEKSEIPKGLMDAAALEAARHAAKAKAISKAFYFAGSVAILDLIIKLLLYYLHERIWQSINFGWIHKHSRRRRINKIRHRRLKDLIKQ
ncbi:DUF2061 domain-containing protein [Bacteroidota bacterium]